MRREERRLRAIIRLKLEASLLPREEPARIWAGPGNNEVCSACDEKITTKQTVYEWEFEGSKFQMHITCYDVWNTIRRR
jgi:hypothetical protein